MDKYVNCIAHNSSEGQLLIGNEKTALVDCGMAFCSDKTINNIKSALGNRSLDYILITHTHYDHIGALPFIKKEWPNAQTVTSEAGAAVLLKDTPRRVIRELSINAAGVLGGAFDFEYSDDVFKADIIVKDGDTIFLGDITIEALETPGHTRDSLCYFIPELELLILNETPGVLMPDGFMYPCYLTGYDDTLRSIEKCRNKPYKYLSLPHRGIAKNEDTDGYFDRSLAANKECYNFILDMKQKNYNEEEMLDLFYKKYGTPTLLTYQPKEAFIANARATITCTLKGTC
ncbi:MAG: MBL fold metallo-hydrolase [Treponema sp.]|nr:MBL fold metallo-hydrolase [Treponema sp.]